MKLPKPSSRAQAAGLIIGALALANILTTWVLISNLDAMLYPVEADAIMIPIAYNFFNSLHLLLWSSLGIVLPRHHIGWRIASRILLGVAAMYTLALVVYWWCIGGVLVVPVSLFRGCIISADRGGLYMGSLVAPIQTARSAHSPCLRS